MAVYPEQGVWGSRRRESGSGHDSGVVDRENIAFFAAQCGQCMKDVAHRLSRSLSGSDQREDQEEECAARDGGAQSVDTFC
jgi:hypothetical protein